MHKRPQLKNAAVGHISLRPLKPTLPAPGYKSKRSSGTQKKVSGPRNEPRDTKPYYPSSGLRDIEKIFVPQNPVPKISVEEMAASFDILGCSQPNILSPQPTRTEVAAALKQEAEFPEIEIDETVDDLPGETTKVTAEPHFSEDKVVVDNNYQEDIVLFRTENGEEDLLAQEFFNEKHIDQHERSFHKLKQHYMAKLPSLVAYTVKDKDDNEHLFQATRAINNSTNWSQLSVSIDILTQNYYKPETYKIIKNLVTEAEQLTVKNTQSAIADAEQRDFEQIYNFLPAGVDVKDNQFRKIGREVHCELEVNGELYSFAYNYDDLKIMEVSFANNLNNIPELKDFANKVITTKTMNKLGMVMEKVAANKEMYLKKAKMSWTEKLMSGVKSAMSTLEKWTDKAVTAVAASFKEIKENQAPALWNSLKAFGSSVAQKVKGFFAPKQEAPTRKPTFALPKWVQRTAFAAALLGFASSIHNPRNNTSDVARADAAPIATVTPEPESPAAMSVNSGPAVNTPDSLDPVVTPRINSSETFSMAEAHVARRGREGTMIDFLRHHGIDREGSLNRAGRIAHLFEMSEVSPLTTEFRRLQGISLAKDVITIRVEGDYLIMESRRYRDRTHSGNPVSVATARASLSRVAAWGRMDEAALRASLTR